ncbi:low-specificity L-threonine aldolase [Mesorhizobium sp.]|uniref:low-specificity L-threonine aldolase n=1 Tax=Mesorhizobium sp. TaxID=1871066 RepID=UPI000FE76CBC|nr:low-specificity L-threonine aldolase [Mesorhizobium sp.]RWK56818.1 MAG: low-specificity L-threonine aldolase [Mesorhizobium sp.]TIP42834.1 MAG: low-specificity L-threonine aldolase [Mesorhizobium sp.]
MQSNAIRLDFRSDTVTRPTPQMRAAMAAAEVGDDVLGDDFTVKALEARVAALFGKEAGLLLPTGTMANLAAIMSHCQRGEGYLCGSEAHTYLWEAGGAAVLGSVQPQPLPVRADGTIRIDDLHAVVKADDPHFAVTRLVTIENTFVGRILPRDYLDEVVEFARVRKLATHFDGARVFNAAAGLGVDVACLAEGFDSVSVCFSKGLGAPLGSVLVGDDPLIARARRWRKMLGGGMRQAGIVAAAGLYALDHHVERLAEDHANAKALADGFSGIKGLTVTPPQSNMVFVELAPELAIRLSEALRDLGIAAGFWPGGRMRWVTHLDVDRVAVDEAIAAVREVAEAP